MTQPSPSLVDRAESRIGTTIREKYRIERVLGVGGMATVYLTTHRNGSRAALKILHPELAVHDVHRERFVREAYVANSIEHDGAVRVVDDDVAEDNCPFLVMELLEGENLDERRRRIGRFDVRELLVMAYALCDTLGAAHASGVVHRDIKPDNLFLTKSGALKILDFGIARVRHESGALGTRTGIMMGTPAFMPPEQALGRRAEIDARTDLWAAGATMFTLLSGVFVHEADSPEEMVVWSATQRARPLRDVLPEIPLPVADVVDKALAFKRDDRFASAHAMRDAIAQAHLDVFGESIETTPMPSGPTSLPPSSFRSARNPSADVLTLPADASGNVATVLAGGSGPGNAAPTIVEQVGAHRDAPTVVEVSGRLPVASELLAVTRVEGTPQTHRSGEPLPSSRRRRRKRWALGLVAALAATVSVLVGVRGVVGGPVEPLKPATNCKQHAECAGGERCDDAGHCVVANGCISNAACIAENGGKPSLCRQDTHKCVPLESQWCRVLSEKTDLANDDTVWVGAMYPEHDKTMSYGREAMLTIDLARRDFAALTGGLPAVKPGGRPRPLGIVACDDTENYEQSAEHLINDVGVSAILGFGRSKEVLDLASRYFIPKNILALASNTASMLSSIPHEAEQPRMVFRVTTEAVMATRSKVAAIREIVEPELRGPGGVLGKTAPLKIAALRTENASGTSHSDAFVSALRQRPSPQGIASEEVRAFSFSESHSLELSTADEQRVRDLLEFAPHVVVDVGVQDSPYVPIERGWPTKSAYRARYVIGGAMEREVLVKFIASHKSANARLMASNPSSDLPATRPFRIRYNGAVLANARNDSVNAAPYDAFYIFAYAAMSLGQTPLTGTNLARAVKRLLPPGTPIDVGPSGILPAFKELSAGRNIDLGGAQTSLDFSLETGDPTVDFELNCVDVKTLQRVFAGVYYRAKTGHLEGTWKCP